MKTIQYYNDNAQAFYERTLHADVSTSYHRFLRHLSEKAHIMDAGCGVGRDTKYFLSQGHHVTAFDASEKMVEFAAQETGITIAHLTFQELNFDQVFDGVWAQASLLHVSYEETREIYERIHRSLKPHGIFYASYKYGDCFMPTDERDFYHMNEDKVKQYFEGLFEVLEMWQEKDTRSQAYLGKEGLWLNFIVRKV